MKCVGVAKFSKTAHVRCGSVWSKKLLCAECVGVPKFAAHKYSASHKLRTWCTSNFPLRLPFCNKFFSETPKLSSLLFFSSLDLGMFEGKL